MIRSLFQKDNLGTNVHNGFKEDMIGDNRKQKKIIRDGKDTIYDM